MQMIDFFKKNIDYFKKFVLAFAVIVVYKTFDNITSIFHSLGIVFNAAAPFFSALVIAYMLNLPAIKLTALLQRIKNKRISEHAYGFSIMIIYICAALVLSITIYAIVPALYQNVLDFSNSLPDYISAVVYSLSQNEIVQKYRLMDNIPGVDSILSSF